MSDEGTTENESVAENDALADSSANVTKTIESTEINDKENAVETTEKQTDESTEAVEKAAEKPCEDNDLATQNNDLLTEPIDSPEESENEKEYEKEDEKENENENEREDEKENENEREDEKDNENEKEDEKENENDTTDGIDSATERVVDAEEPMEVDEHSNDAENMAQEAKSDEQQSDTVENQTNEIAAENSEINEVCETNETDEANETKDTNEPKESNESDEINETDARDAVANEESSAKHDESTAMEVDECETPQGEDVPDAINNADNDDSVMEHNVEQFNCSNSSDSNQKEQTVSDDPFDSLFKNDGNSNQEPNQKDKNETSSSSITEQTDGDDQHDQHDQHEEADGAGGSDRDDYDNDVDDDDNDAGDTSSHHDGSAIEAVDDIEEGKGADEELCLLPDEDREISDADKERAMQNQQQADENDDQDNEANDGILEAIEENGEKDSEDVQDDQENEPTNETEASEQAQIESTTVPFAPNVGEIKEIETDSMKENQCVECGETVKCKYSLLKEVPPSEDDTDSGVQTEVQYLCNTTCVTKFNNENTQYKVVIKKVPILFAIDTEQTCKSCEQIKLCKYRFKEPADADEFSYVCEEDCLTNFTETHPDRFVLTKKRFIIEEVSNDEAETENKCLQCGEDTKCKYMFKEDTKLYFLCTEPCLNLLLAEQPDRFQFKRQSIRVKDLSRKPVNETAQATRESRRVAEKSKKMVARTEDQQRVATLDREASFSRRCAQCYTDIMMLESNLQWETMDFCNESCLGQYQQQIGAACQSCQNAVSVASMGKYCVRFGFELRQFCRSVCLDAFKKGLKVCSYCQLDIAKNDEFLAPINGQFKDFCSKKCMRFYEQIFNTKKHATKTCAVCNNQKPVRVEIIIDSNVHHFCSNPCFSAFSFVNNVNPDCCSMCRKYFERKSNNAHTIYQGNDAKVFCSKICMNIYIIAKREIAPCQWCKVRKYNFDMIQKTTPTHDTMMLCSINCLSMCEVSMNAIAMKQQKCDQCNSLTTPQYHLTMSDASMRNFCTYQCVMSFQSQFSRAPLTLDGEVADQRLQPVPTGLPKRIKTHQLQQQRQQQQQSAKTSPAKNKIAPVTRNSKTNNYQASKQSTTSNNLVISSVTSLAASTRSTRRSAQNSSINNDLISLQPVVELEPLPDSVLEKTARPVGRPRSSPAAPAPTQSSPQVRVEKQTQIVTVPPLPKKIANAATMCAPATHNKEVQARPMQFTVGCQTDSYLERKMVIPIPVPIYMPTPLPMYAQPFPVPVPIPLPIPVPVFIPTTRNSANGIMKEIKKIQDKMPADPFEAELLMMAEMVAGDKKKEDETDSSEEENEFPTEEIGGNNSFGEDIMQMALKMATEYDPAGVDLEASMQAHPITAHSHPGMGGHDVMHNPMMIMEDQRQTRKRGPAPRAQRQPAKRGRRGAIPEPPPPEPPREPIEKADANMCLKFTFGVNAWKQWVMTKNSELEKSSVRRKLFKTELLQLTADELNYSLCLFVKEVRKPNGSEYAPDTIYYLVLGIQEYLYENGRIDNIFTDPYYERFTDCLDEVAKKFSVLYNDSQYIVTRVEEEHLWECKQLGAHSPHVLLSTLMFFNTKHFNLTTVEEHMQLSFSHIMKHWKRNPNQGSGKVAGSRNVLLRFYPPQSAHIDNSRKKKVYEQQENEENPLRCPVKLYEFYLSKCPESVKTRNDVFYLLPERSCVPDSPVWYSTQALGKEALSKMLHRVKMVKEINIALLTS